MITQDGESSCHCVGMQFHPQANVEQRNCERLLMPGLHSALLQSPCWVVEASQLLLSEIFKNNHLSQMRGVIFVKDMEISRRASSTFDT